nr:PIN domain-containing protein [uncultured Acidocella sp.]
MRHIADRFVVILDANVLYPFRVRDILLRFYHAGLFRGRWTNQILDEWTSNLDAAKPELQASIDSQLSAIRRAFPEALVTGYEPLISGLQLPDMDDRHVLAAAIKCGAQHIVTENLSDFPSDVLETFGIEAIGADEFLSRIFELYPADAVEILKEMRLAYRKPPFTASEFVMELTARGLPKLASQIRPIRGPV